MSRKIHCSCCCNPCDSAGCADICVNEQGTAICLCRDGFDLQENGKDCIEAAGDYHRAIVLNNGTHLCLLPMDVISDNETGSLYCFYRHFNDKELILYVDVDMDTREILFATPYNMYRVAINRTHEAKPVHVQSLGPVGEIRDNREGQELIYQAHEPYITGLSYNWVSRQLCWSQTRPDGIFIIDEERNIMAVTHNNRTSHPRDPVFVLNAKDEHLFWISRLGNETVIETLLVTGDDTEPRVLGEKIHKIKHLQHDVDNKLLVVQSQGEASEKVFYITYRGDEVDSFDLPRHSYAFAQYKDLFLSAGLDEANNTILSLYDRRDKSEVNVHIKEWKGPVLSLNVIDLGVLQPSVPDPCSVISLGCDQICVPEDDQAKCFCDVGYYLVNTTCETAPVTDNFILVTDFTHGKLYQIPLDKPLEVHGIHPPGAVRLQDIAYSANTNEIYLVEETSNEVWTVSVNGVWGVYIANLDEYREEFRGRPRRLVPDPTSNYIYFLSNTIQLDSEILDHHPRYIVGVISPKQYGTSSPRGYSTILYRGYSGFPVDLVLHPKKGMMYWTDDTPKLWRANMDGTNPTPHAADGRSYYGLTIDYQDDMLYWSEYQNAKIYRSGLNGKNIEEFYSDSKSYVNDVNIFGDYLYYSGFTSVHITRVNKHNISDVTTFGPNAGIGTIKSFDIFASNDTVNMTRHAACMVGNGGCSHFCLPRADGKRTCACMYNVKLLSDNRTCDVPKCPTEIPNGRLLDSCSNRAWEKCDNFTCDEGFERNKVVDSLICNESGHWSYDGSTLCIPIDKDSDKDKRVLIIGVLAGGSLLIVIVSTVVILYALVRKGKILANFRWSKTSDVSSDLPSNLDDSGVADTSVSYIDHLSWLRTRINQFLILDDDADKALAGPDDRHR